MKIPLIIKHHNSSIKNYRSDEFVSVIDFLRTVLNVSKIEVPEQLPAASMLDLIERKDAINKIDYIFTGRKGSSVMLTRIRGQHFKRIHNLLHRKENPKFHFFETHVNRDFNAVTKEVEISSPSPKVVESHKVWKNPTKYELYDLENDPYKLNNLSSNSEYIQTLDQSILVLVNWQKETNDFLADPVKLPRFNHEIDSINSPYPILTYAKNKDFSWQYHTFFVDKN